MPKNSGESMKTIRTPARPQASRGILHGFAGPGGPVGPRLEAMAMAAPKRFDPLKPSPASPKKAGGGSVDPRQQRF